MDAMQNNSPVILQPPLLNGREIKMATVPPELKYHLHVARLRTSAYPARGQIWSGGVKI